MNKKGIFPLIATVLVIGFTIALASVIMVWGGGFIVEDEDTFNSEEDVCLEELSLLCGKQEGVLAFVENEFHCGFSDDYDGYCCRQCHEWRPKTTCEKMNDDIDSYRGFETEECICSKAGKSALLSKEDRTIYQTITNQHCELTCDTKFGCKKSFHNSEMGEQMECRDKEHECYESCLRETRCTEYREKTPKEKLQWELDKYTCDELYSNYLDRKEDFKKAEEEDKYHTGQYHETLKNRALAIMALKGCDLK